MSSCQRTIIIVKPDGVSKGLLGEILRRLHAHGLEVLGSARMVLDPSWVRELYAAEADQWYFEEVVSWVSSGSVHILTVSGPDAVRIVKYRVIGRYPDGLRGEFSESTIRNIAHAPETESDAEREVALVEPIISRRKSMESSRFTGKMVFALTGMSECGKSTVGKYLDSIGIPRLKIARLFERIRDRQSPGTNLQEFIADAEKRDSYTLWDAFIDELYEEMMTRGTAMASLESLYGGGFGSYLREKLGEHFAIIYIDATPERRLQLQMVREGLGSIEEATALLVPRDKIKASSGIPALKVSAEEVIKNSGTLDELYRAVDAIIGRHRP